MSVVNCNVCIVAKPVAYHLATVYCQSSVGLLIFLSVIVFLKQVYSFVFVVEIIKSLSVELGSGLSVCPQLVSSSLPKVSLKGATLQKVIHVQFHHEPNHDVLPFYAYQYKVKKINKIKIKSC